LFTNDRDYKESRSGIVPQEKNNLDPQSMNNQNGQNPG
jgi:hypothetical protein